MTPALPDVLAELNEIADGLHDWGMRPLAARLRAVAAQIAERERRPPWTTEYQEVFDALTARVTQLEERERAIAEAVRDVCASTIRALDLAPILAAEESREPSPAERGSR
jgi:hypothetical protein